MKIKPTSLTFKLKSTIAIFTLLIAMESTPSAGVPACPTPPHSPDPKCYNAPYVYYDAWNTGDCCQTIKGVWNAIDVICEVTGTSCQPVPPTTAAPTPAPTAAPTPAPTAAPTPAPTAAPTPAPTAAPGCIPPVVDSTCLSAGPGYEILDSGKCCSTATKTCVAGAWVYPDCIPYPTPAPAPAPGPAPAPAPVPATDCGHFIGGREYCVKP